MATYDPNATYYATQRIRRTAHCVVGNPKNTPGIVYIDPVELTAKGKPVAGSILFTMADRTPAQVKMLVEEKQCIALVEK